MSSARPASVASAMNFFSNCDALIIDLRNNGGGWGEMVAFMCSYFVYGDTTVLMSTGYSRPGDEYFQSWSMPYVPGKTMSNIPLYIITSKSTFSAAEEFCYNLKHLKRATIVGETTRGGAHPISPKVLNDNLAVNVYKSRTNFLLLKTDIIVSIYHPVIIG